MVWGKAPAGQSFRAFNAQETRINDPQIKIFGHQWEGHPKPAGAKPPTPDKSNTAGAAYTHKSSAVFVRVL